MQKDAGRSIQFALVLEQHALNIPLRSECPYFLRMLMSADSKLYLLSLCYCIEEL